MRNIIRISLIIISISLLLSGCQMMSPLELDRRPDCFRGSVWESEDRTVRFTVDEHYQCYGTITINETAIDVNIDFGINKSRSICFYDLGTMNENGVPAQIEQWEGYYKSMDHFVAIVKESTYFEEGQEFTFYRVDE